MYPLIGAFPEMRCREPKFSPNEAVEQVKRGGRNGPPVYDCLGFELDYKSVVRPSRPQSFFRTKKWQDICDIRSEQSNRKKAIIGQYDTSFAANDRVSDSFAADDRISRDLNIPFHQVDLEEYEEWQRRGFKVEPGELDYKNRSQAEDDRLLTLATGSAHRKGNKRG